MSLRKESLSIFLSKQSGSMMIESLVTIAVVSFGLLGVVGLLVTGISAANMSQMRSSAINLANEIAESMRANQTGVTDSIKNSSGYIVSDSAASLPSKVCKPQGATVLPVSCDPMEMAAFDVYDWKRKIEASLPNGKGEIARLVSSNAAFEIRITWLEDKTTATNMNFKLRFEP